MARSASSVCSLLACLSGCCFALLPEFVESRSLGVPGSACSCMQPQLPPARWWSPSDHFTHVRCAVLVQEELSRDSNGEGERGRDHPGPTSYCEVGPFLVFPRAFINGQARNRHPRVSGYHNPPVSGQPIHTVQYPAHSSVWFNEQPAVCLTGRMASWLTHPSWGNQPAVAVLDRYNATSYCLGLRVFP
ncbi:hypothetical protein B0T17DRAFT_509574 [Bombardia bombarda]|uniref:Secreted protein n=1 Tax=Bombardia bombarda TaxID=252184 RepID=A0AA39WMC7_9PEZI|nr:hypothetical protein B0T17DRAFT_509574 [Bombardia bombarda]